MKWIIKFIGIFLLVFPTRLLTLAVIEYFGWNLPSHHIGYYGVWIPCFILIRLAASMAGYDDS